MITSYSQINSILPLPNNDLLKDPFLTAVYWEKCAFYKFLDHDFQSAADAYQKAIQQGFPAAHLYYDRGFCLHLAGKTLESKKAFEQSQKIANEPLPNSEIN